MANRLVPGMYGRQDFSKVGLFGLVQGQISPRTLKMVHNGGWYNHLGQKIGWGDLSSKNFRRISAGLRRGELFIVLSEKDSFWSFVSHAGVTGGLSTVRKEEQNPGVGYVSDRAIYVIAPRKIYAVTWPGDERGAEWVDMNLCFHALYEDAVKPLMLETANR